MSSNEEIKLGFKDKVYITLFFVMVFIGLLIVINIFGTKDDVPSGYNTCETRFDSTACPDPNDEYDQEIEDISRKYPDDSY